MMTTSGAPGTAAEPGRWAHVTYASFRNVAGRGGWHAGPSVGAGQDDEQFVAEYAPTNLAPTQAVDDFISAAEIEALPRRFEYLPFGDRALFLQSVPAGTDATGRPGNVFTHAVIDREPGRDLAAVYPINLYRSPALRTPFRMASVNAVELPAEATEPQAGPLADLSVAWMMVRELFGDRTGALHRLQDALLTGGRQPVLVVKNPNEAAYWLQALSSTLAPVEARRLLRFSTFERAASLPLPAAGTGRAVAVAPSEDRKRLLHREDLCVIDPADPTTHASEPATDWSRLTRGVFAPDREPGQVVAALTEATRGLGREEIAALLPGHGLARAVRAGLVPADAALLDVAERMLGSPPEEGPGPAETSAGGEDRRWAERWAERALRQLSTANSIATILVWLRREDTPALLDRLLDERVIDHSSRDHVADLLRVYYTVNLASDVRPLITGDRDRDGRLTGMLAHLTLAAVEKHLRQLAGESPESARFRLLGRQIARRDLPGVLDGATWPQARELIRDHLDVRRLPFDRVDTGEIFAAVARGMREELTQNRKDEN